MVVCHFGLLIGILHQFLDIVFNLKLDVFHVLQPSKFIMVSSFFLSYCLCRRQKSYLNDKITCNYRVINSQCRMGTKNRPVGIS